MATQILPESRRSCNEIWKPVPSLPGFHVSNLGSVRRDPSTAYLDGAPCRIAPGKILTPQKDYYFYLSVRIAGRRTKLYVHRLVCEAFHGPPPQPEFTVDHIDADRFNNDPSNLEWVTRRENISRQNQDGRGIEKRGEENPSAKLTRQDVLKIRRLREAGATQNDLAVRFNVTSSTIWGVCARKSWSWI